ncbi:MAG: hypothetical protein R3F59_39295, partial [Myxococcota bacterium]
DAGASPLAARPLLPPPSLEEDATSDATEETAHPSGPFGPEAEPEEDDHTVEAPSDAPPSSVPLTGPPSYVGMRLGQTGTTDVAPQPPAPEAAPVAEVPPAPTRPPSAEVAPPPPLARSSPALPTPPREPAPRSGGTAGLAGCFGLSLVGITAVGVGSFVVVGLLLVVVAAGAGWFGDLGGGGGDPGVVVGEDPPRFTKARRLSEDDRAAVERAVRKTRPEIVDHCGEGADVTAELLVDATGKVVYAKVSPQRLGTVKPQCLRRAFERVTTPVSTEGRAEIHIAL